MTAQDIAVISASVVLLVQIFKWFGMPKWLAPFFVLLASVGGVGLYAWSMGDFDRGHAFDYFASTVMVMAGAAGVFGFVRNEQRDQPPPAPVTETVEGTQPTRTLGIPRTIEGPV